MVEQIQVKRLTMGSVFKLLFLGLAFSLIPFSIVMGILGFFDMSTVTWNNRPLTGVSALIYAPFIGLFITLMFTGFLGLGIAVGLWIYSRFKPLTLFYWK